MKRVLFVALTLTATAVPVFAQGINDIQQNQIQRIKSGVANGSLSPQEAQMLQMKFGRINELESRLRASGNGLSSQERALLTNELNDLNRQIAIQKQDSNNRAWSGSGNRFGNDLRNQFGNNFGPPGPAGGQGQGFNNGQFNNGRPGFNQGINSSQAMQQSRIAAGVADGSLSSQEAQILQNKFNRINQLEAQLRSTGNGLSPQERAKLNNELGELNRQISKQRNDSNDIGGHPGQIGGRKNWSKNGMGPGPNSNWRNNPGGRRRGQSGWNR